MTIMTFQHRSRHGLGVKMCGRGTWSRVRFFSLEILGLLEARHGGCSQLLGLEAMDGVSNCHILELVGH